MRVLWLPDVLRAAGLTVVETAGWQTRGYELDAVEGVGAHHTASPSTSTLATNLHVVTNGNAVAPGPIAQLLLWRDGTFYVIASGRANHAGAGGPLGSWLPASVPGVVSPANRRTLGIEAVNSGVGEVWSPAMLDAYEIGTAAILRHIGHGADRAFTHQEYAPTRKIDPAGPTGGRIATLPGSLTWSPSAWRARVASRLTPPVQEDDMQTLHVYVEGDPTRAEAIVQIRMDGFNRPEEVAPTVRVLGAQRRKVSAVEYDALRDAATPRP